MNFDQREGIHANTFWHKICSKMLYPHMWSMVLMVIYIPGLLKVWVGRSRNVSVWISHFAFCATNPVMAIIYLYVLIALKKAVTCSKNSWNKKNWKCDPVFSLTSYIRKCFILNIGGLKVGQPFNPPKFCIKLLNIKKNELDRVVKKTPRGF